MTWVNYGEDWFSAYYGVVKLRGSWSVYSPTMGWLTRSFETPGEAMGFAEDFRGAGTWDGTR